MHSEFDLLVNFRTFGTLTGQITLGLIDCGCVLFSIIMLIYQRNFQRQFPLSASSMMVVSAWNGTTL
jgi:hypothetical protein